MSAMRTRPGAPALSAALSGVLLVGGLLAGCSSDADPQASEESSAASAPESDEGPEPYLDVPEGTELTAQAEELELGDTATVAYEANKQKVGVVDLTVIRIDKGKIKDLVAFKLEDKFENATPYYVRARVKNVGETNISGTLPPMYVKDGQDRLVQVSQFQSVFKPCPSPSLPKGFTKGEQTTNCWVYLVRGNKDVQGVSYYPVDGFVPIEWTGKITQAGAKKNG